MDRAMVRNMILYLQMIASVKSDHHLIWGCIVVSSRQTRIDFG